MLVHDAARPFTPADVFHRVITELRAGAVAVVPALPDCVETRRDADLPLVMKQNRITVTAINADRTYGYPVDGKRELAKLKHFVKHHAPRP